MVRISSLYSGRWDGAFNIVSLYFNEIPLWPVGGLGPGMAKIVGSNGLACKGSPRVAAAAAAAPASAFPSQAFGAKIICCPPACPGREGINIVYERTSHAVFKIEVFECPSYVIQPFTIYLAQNNPSKRNPELKMKMSLGVLDILRLLQELTRVGQEVSLQEVEFRWLILNSSHCTGNMYHRVHARV